MKWNDDDDTMNKISKFDNSRIHTNRGQKKNQSKRETKRDITNE